MNHAGETPHGPESERMDAERIESPEDFENLASATSLDIESEQAEFMNDTLAGLGTVEAVSSSLGIDASSELGELKVELNAANEEVEKLGEESRRKISELTGKEEEQGIEDADARFETEENRFIDVKAFPGLRERYLDAGAGAGYVRNQIKEFAAKSGLGLEFASELVGRAFGAETVGDAVSAIQSHIDSLLLDKQRGRFNPEKHKTLSEETKRFLELIVQAQNEGDIPKDVDVASVLELVSENVWSMAYQDRVAAENTLGDHGVRHVIGYNIRVTEQIFDEIAKSQPVKAVDRLMAHQIMLLHDLGYASDPIRGEINKGNFVDPGHNVISAKVFRGMSGAGGAFSRIFSDEQRASIHEGILWHDDSTVDFKIGENTPDARRENLLSAVHIADNTHAFEDKLPELLYAVPSTLKIMRLLKVAGEIGDKETVEKLKNQLAGEIASNEDYSSDDKEALTQAVKTLNSSSYKFTVGRICGNSPKILISPEGAITIEVQESAIHQEAVGLFDQAALDQLRKFIADLTGVKKAEVTDEMMNQAEIKAGKVIIKPAIRENRAAGLTDFQERINEIIADEAFRNFSIEDSSLSRLQRALEAATEETADLVAQGYRTEGDARPSGEIIAGVLSQIKNSRSGLLAKFTNESHAGE